MISVKETIIVEGEYDKKKILSFLDANVIVTDGFRIFKNKEMQEMIRKIARKDGIVVLMDSDRAGFIIRNFLKSCTQGEKVFHAFIPEISGKEKRKTEPGKEGLLGVEGMEKNVILESLRSCGATLSGETPAVKGNKITKLDLYQKGFYGRENSRAKREEFLKKHGLPLKISPNMLLDILNLLFTKEDIE